MSVHACGCVCSLSDASGAFAEMKGFWWGGHLGPWQLYINLQNFRQSISLSRSLPSLPHPLSHLKNTTDPRVLCIRLGYRTWNKNWFTLRALARLKPHQLLCLSFWTFFSLSCTILWRVSRTSTLQTDNWEMKQKHIVMWKLSLGLEYYNDTHRL